MMVATTPPQELQTAWRNIFGDNAVIRTTDRWDNMVQHLGYISVDVPRSVKDTLSTTITTDKQLIQKSQEALRKTEVVLDYKLTARALAHLRLARAIAAPFNVKSVQAAVIPPASDRRRTAGFYDHTTEEIVLHLEILESARSTVDAMVHELGHHRAYVTKGDIKLAEDLQPAHSEAMTYVAARVFQQTTEKKFDEYLKEAVW